MNIHTPEGTQLALHNTSDFLWLHQLSQWAVVVIATRCVGSDVFFYQWHTGNVAVLSGRTHLTSSIVHLPHNGTQSL